MDKDNLHVIFTNVDIISNKLIEFESFITEKKPHVICLNEILSKSKTNTDDEIITDLSFPGYTKFFNTKEKTSRGTVTFVQEHLNAQLDVELNEMSPTDCVWVQLMLKDPVLLGNIYRSPSNTYF